MNLRRVVSIFIIVIATGWGGYRAYNYANKIYDTLPGTGYLPLEDPDAGPVRIARSACFLAKVNKTGQECPEPRVLAGHADTYLTRARWFMEMEQNEKALADVDSALAIDPDDAAAHHLAGRLALTLFDIERADKEIVAARRLKPNDPQIETSYAIVLMGRNANQEAKEILSNVITKNPRYLYPRLQRAQVNLYQAECCGGDYWLLALADYNMLIYRAGPKMPLLKARAHVLLALNHPEEAAADLTAALKTAPNQSDLIRDRAKAYAMEGKYEDALGEFNALLEVQGGAPVHPMFGNNRAKVLMDRANVLFGMHRYEDATKDAVASVTAGGKPAVLRAQIMLRRHGFSDLPLDGQVSDQMRQALAACFGLQSCMSELRAI
jgi:tetratricopeptide (TPR) repeat protein